MCVKIKYCVQSILPIWGIHVMDFMTTIGATVIQTCYVCVGCFLCYDTILPWLELGCFENLRKYKMDTHTHSNVFCNHTPIIAIETNRSYCFVLSCISQKIVSKKFKSNCNVLFCLRILKESDVEKNLS